MSNMVRGFGKPVVTGAARALLLEALEELKNAELRETNNEARIAEIDGMLSALEGVVGRRRWQPIIRKKTVRRLLDMP